MERDLTKTFQDENCHASLSGHFLANTKMELDVAAILTQINRNKLIKTTTWKKKTTNTKQVNIRLKQGYFEMVK